MASYAEGDTCIQEDTLACWSEWYDRCALARCNEETQYVLTEFAGHQFTRYLQRYAYRTNLPARAKGISGNDAWHLLESRLTVHDTRQGKRYKTWLFTRGGAHLGAIEGGAAVLMRDIVRDHLRNECSPPRTVSLQTPVPSGSEMLTMADLLPGRVDPRNEVEVKELTELGQAHAEEFLKALHPSERIALLAKHLGVSLAHPAILTAAGCGKTKLSKTYHTTLGELADRLRKLYATEDMESIRTLVILTYHRLNELIRRWAATEAPYPQLLPLLESS